MDLILNDMITNLPGRQLAIFGSERLQTLYMNENQNHTSTYILLHSPEFLFKKPFLLLKDAATPELTSIRSACSVIVEKYVANVLVIVATIAPVVFPPP
jgi:coproporphyrinogen III oxidase-like Fe-S oxidoreductase